MFINAFNLQHNPPGAWQEQYIPDLNGRPLKDITFTDSLTGYALIGHDNADSNFILKTTNSGDNWNVIRIENRRINKISFLNNDTGFACGANPLTAYLIRTTNGGLNWSPLNTSSTGWTITEMFVLNTDTIWTCEDEINFFLRRTTNGGATWANQFEQTSRLKEIYMFNGRIGFMCESSKLFKTTNSGDNWILQTGGKAFGDIYFADSLHGWKRNMADLTNDTMVKTTNGGMNWFSIDVPRRGSIYGGNLSILGGMRFFTNINTDTIWGTGGYITYSGNIDKGLLFMSTNGGQSWLIQIPDTSFRISQYWYNSFTNKNNGWTFTFSTNKGIHTRTGGDATFITNIIQTQNSVSDKFILFQNYPNPFNPKTKIKYQLDFSKFVTIKIYDLQGKEIITLVNKKQNTGYHEVEFNSDEARNRIQLSSGIYFYSLYLDGEWADTKKMILLK